MKMNRSTFSVSRNTYLSILLDNSTRRADHFACTAGMTQLFKNQNVILDHGNSIVMTGFSTIPAMYTFIFIDSDGRLNVGVAWADNILGRLEVTMRMSSNRGLSWNPKFYLSTSSVGAWQPDIAWNRNNGEVRVLWTDYRDGNGELYHRLYDGNTWGSETRLTQSTGSANDPSFAIDDDGSSFLIWQNVTPATCQIVTCKCFP